LTVVVSATDTRRSELLEAAVAVLRRTGFERMRLRDVADEAGVSIGLLQHYFGTREQLGREAFAAACGERASRVAAAAAPAGPAWPRVRRLLENAFEPEGLEERAATWLDLCASGGRDDELREAAGRVQDVWRAPLRAAIDDGIETGELAPRVDADVAVDLLLAIVDGVELAVTIADEQATPPERLLGPTLALARDLLGVR
jgi:AcrR family transcriptional regulator